MGGGGDRLSNIEALRLLSMLMVLNLHSFWGYDYGDGIGQAFDFFRESSSICAVNVFLLISGYFGIKWKWKSFYNLVFQIFFYSFGVYLIACGIGVVDFSLKGFLSNVPCTYSHYSFVKHYLLLYFFAPILNAFVEKCSNKKLFIFIILLIICENFISRGNKFSNYCVMYLIGRWLKGIQFKEILIVNPVMSYCLVTTLIALLSYLFYLFTPINTAELMCNFIFGYDYSAPLVILQAVFLFLAFSRLRFTSKFINWCASSCLAIFLIHSHPSIRWIGYYNITESFYNLPIWQHSIYLILLIIVVFFGSILIDKIRIIISDYVYILIEKLLSIIPSKYLSIDTYIPKSVNKII